MNELADFTTQRIEGYVAQNGARFDVPLYSHIRGNLWMGGCPAQSAPGKFKFIVSLYPWGKYRIQAHQVHTTYCMLDSRDPPNAELVCVIARHVATCMEFGLTLVHCQAGLNRSGLICAAALMEQGIPAREAIMLLRAQRCAQVLCNPVFVEFLTGPAGVVRSDWLGQFETE